MGKDSSKIFVSYSRKDSIEFVKQLYTDLKSKGLNMTRSVLRVDQ